MHRSAKTLLTFVFPMGGGGPKASLQFCERSEPCVPWLSNPAWSRFLLRDTVALGPVVCDWARPAESSMSTTDWEGWSEFSWSLTLSSSASDICTHRKIAWTHTVITYESPQTIPGHLWITDVESIHNYSVYSFFDTNELKQAKEEIKSIS